MVTRLDHVGIYVSDLEAALRFWRDVVGLECTPIERPGQGSLRLAHACLGGVELELIEAPVEETMLRHMPYRGPGIYHIGLRTDDLEGAAAGLRAAGLRLLDPEPRSGGGMRVQFADPAGPPQGVLIELVERLRPGPAELAAEAGRERSR